MYSHIEMSFSACPTMIPNDTKDRSIVLNLRLFKEFQFFLYKTYTCTCTCVYRGFESIIQKKFDFRCLQYIILKRLFRNTNDSRNGDLSTMYLRLFSFSENIFSTLRLRQLLYILACILSEGMFTM